MQSIGFFIFFVLITKWFAQASNSIGSLSSIYGSHETQPRVPTAENITKNEFPQSSCIVVRTIPLVVSCIPLTVCPAIGFVVMPRLRIVSCSPHTSSLSLSLSLSVWSILFGQFEGYIQWGFMLAGCELLYRTSIYAKPIWIQLYMEIAWSCCTSCCTSIIKLFIGV